MSEFATVKVRVSDFERCNADLDRLEDENESLKTENAKLRELVSLMDKRDVLLPCWRGCNADCRFYGSHCERIGTLMSELGFEVES
jgi:hypothetical protein